MCWIETEVSVCKRCLGRGASSPPKFIMCWNPAWCSHREAKEVEKSYTCQACIQKIQEEEDKKKGKGKEKAH